MQKRATTALLTAFLICLAPMASLAVVIPYSQDFETMDLIGATALSDDGWIVYGNVYDPTGAYLYGYGTYPAPNNGLAFCQLTELQGGIEQGVQQLVVFSDYENADHAVGNLIESNTFKETTVTAENVGQTWIFQFDAKQGNLEGSSTALAFIKTLNPAAGWATTNFISADMTAAGIDWSTNSLSIVIDASLEGQIIQFGFSSTATLYEGAGVYYDNLSFLMNDPSAVPGETPSLGMTLNQNFPNPFNPMTRIEFSLEKPGNVDLSVFDMAGRKVATLQQGQMAQGAHFVTWTGRTDSGANAAAGQYFYVLKTASGQVSYKMTLLK